MNARLRVEVDECEAEDDIYDPVFDEEYYADEPNTPETMVLMGMMGEL